ncbi:MAG: hypothetical protein AABY22_15885 [Nanoarchaeota archaeon]
MKNEEKQSMAQELIKFLDEKGVDKKCHQKVLITAYLNLRKQKKTGV